MKDTVIAKYLETKIIGFKRDIYQKLDSTNDMAKKYLKLGVKHGTVITTANQSKGRGRGNHKWISAQGKDIAVSIILQPRTLAKEIGIFSLLSGNSIVDTLQDFSVTGKLKWPNDVLVNGKKISGILCESKLHQNEIESMIIGIGLNVNSTIDSYPSSLNSQVSSIKIETGKTNQLEIVLAKLLNLFEKNLDDYLNSGPEPVIEKWIQNCMHINQPITYHQRENLISGIFTGITHHGEAIVEINGEQEIVMSGQII